MNIIVTGASGRMGQAVIRAVAAAEDMVVAAVLARPGHADIGKDAGQLSGIDLLDMAVGDDEAEAFDAGRVVIDFTAPEAMLHYARLAAEQKKAFISGTTGLADIQKAELTEIAQKTPVVWAPNMSVGVTLLMALTEQVAASLDEDFDIEIVDMHHRNKVDAPSGTALGLGEAAALGRKVPLADVACKSRDGQVGPRKRGEIGFSTLRGGDVVGDHTVLFAGDGERIALTHKASSRDIFAKGAVRAVRWVQDKPPGLYSMRDVLGL